MLKSYTKRMVRSTRRISIKTRCQIPEVKLAEIGFEVSYGQHMVQLLTWNLFMRKVNLYDSINL